MSNIFEKFSKIWVNDTEIDLADLETNKGKYHIDNYQGGNVSVKFQLKENEKLTPGIFDGNEQIKNITLSENSNIEIENGSFAGLTNLSEESKQAISETVGEEVFEPKQEEPTEPVEPTEYTVTFKNGDVVVKTVTGVTGTAVEAPANPEKEGYEFKGWSTDGETVILPISKIGEADVTYIALWTEVEEPPFTPKTVYFISYNDNVGTTEYARGSVETTNVTEDDKTKVKVLTNTIEGWVNEEFYVDSNAKEDDNNFYQLFKLENDALTGINVWVKLFSTEQKQEELQPKADENYIEFISYGDNAGQTEWGQGVVFKTNITETIEINQVETELTKVIVKINLSPSKEKLSEWIGKEFYIVSNAVKDDDNLYELYAKENDIITSAGIWVKIYSLFKDEAVMGTNYDYVHDETSWNASYNGGALEHYYEWADKLSMYKEDLWNEADERPAAWADWVKDENNQPILDDNGNIQYVDRLGNPCVRCWNGAVYAPDARYPWIVPYFAQDENAPEERNYIIFSYEGKADVMPWNGIWGNKNKYTGSASLAEEFKDKGFLLYENSDLNKFTAEWQQIIPTWDGTLVQENEEPKFNINDFKMYLLHR